MNKINKILICSVLCIPLIAAIIFGLVSERFSFSGSVPGNSDDNKLSKVRISSEDGSVINEYDSIEVLEDYFNVINNGALITDYKPLEDEVFTNYKVEFIGTKSVDTYKFIMSSDNIGNCVYVDINEKIYSIPADDAKILLMREEFSSANKYSKVVNLNLSYGVDEELVSQIVLPGVYSWNYTRMDGELINKKNEDGSTDIQTLAVPYNKNFAFSFLSDVQPETVNVSVSKGSEVIYNGELGALSAFLNFKTDTLLDISVGAKWHEAENSSFFGEANYKFKLLYDVPSTFKLADKSLKPGEFTVIKVTEGIATNGAITASSEIIANETEVFNYNGNKYIYLPIKPDAAPGKYKINISEFSGETTLEFTVKAKSFKTFDNMLVPVEMTELATEVNIAEYKELVAEYRHHYSEKQLWKDKFLMPVDNAVIECNFGDTLNIPANEIVSDGIYLSSSAGAVVKAANDGVVIYSGETKYSGNTVIIDHGLGVLSYYFNLGENNVSEGENVVKGTVIGSVGTSGYTPFENAVLYSNSVGGCFVNPKTQVDYGIVFE